MIKKILFSAFILVQILFAKESQISIVADTFEADENKHISIFNKNVTITKESDIITSQKAVINFDKENKPLKYEVIDSVNFTISLKDSTAVGSCDKLSYVPKSKVYTLVGNVNITQEPSKRKIQASKVIIDTTNNKITITGEKNKPVKFIFNIKETK